MIQERIGVFETNSSSSHSFTVSVCGYKLLKEEDCEPHSDLYLDESDIDQLLSQVPENILKGIINKLNSKKESKKVRDPKHVNIGLPPGDKSFTVWIENQDYSIEKSYDSDVSEWEEDVYLEESLEQILSCLPLGMLKMHLIKEENKELLTFNDHIEDVIKDQIVISFSMDANDADYIDSRVTLKPEIFFGNIKLIYCLAYVSCDYNFKGHGWGDSVFNHYILKNTDITDLRSILEEFHLLIYSNYCEDLCHSFGDIKVAYYDEDGKRYDITFEKIHEKWKNMSYEEICEEINSIS